MQYRRMEAGVGRRAIRYGRRGGRHEERHRQLRVLEDCFLPGFISNRHVINKAAS